MIGNEVPVIGQSSGVMTDTRLVMVAVIESEPGFVGPAPLPVALVMPALFKQWNVTLMVAPAIVDPEGVPSLELSRAAWLAMVAMGPPAGGIEETTVTAVGPPPVPAHTRSAVAC